MMWVPPVPRIWGPGMKAPDTCANSTGKERDTESGNGYFEARNPSRRRGRNYYPGHESPSIGGTGRNGAAGGAGA